MGTHAGEWGGGGVRAAVSGGDSALERVRLARNMTLEEAADALNTITGLAVVGNCLTALAVVWAGRWAELTRWPGSY
ncbi:hypothetical protein GCM10027162_74620 [Streptomyces incanus]